MTNYHPPTCGRVNRGVGNTDSTLYFSLSYSFFVSHFTQVLSVLTCDILGIGLLCIGTIFKTIICSSVKMDKSHNIYMILIGIEYDTRMILHELEKYCTSRRRV